MIIYMIYLFIRYHLYTLCMAISNCLCFNCNLNERVLSRRIHSEQLILFFQKPRGCAPRVFKVKNQQFLVYSTILTYTQLAK